MKLKKIASLALAGIMAVSMLTACDTTSAGDDNDGVKPPVDDTTPASYSQTILDGVSGDERSIMAAADSDMLTAAVVAAGASLNGFDDIHDLIKYGQGNLKVMARNYRPDSTVTRVVDGFEDNLAEDVVLKMTKDGWSLTQTSNQRYAALYVCDTSMNETQLNNAVSGAVSTIMDGYRDHLNATDIDYTLSVAKADVGTEANGVTLVGIMINVEVTHAA